MDESFSVNAPKARIRGLLVIPDGVRKAPCVILSHGLVSSKESSKFVALSESCLQAGMATCRFDYHGCGESDGAIEETTLTIRIGDLRSVLDLVLRHPLLDAERVGLLGSSFGGCTSLVTASRDSRILCTSLWATPYTLEQKEDSTIADIQFKETLYTDFATYDLLSEARNVSRAIVIHGEMDEVVPCAEGKALYTNMARPKRFERIKGADHRFSVPSHRQRAIDLSLRWFRRFFLGT